MKIVLAGAGAFGRKHLEALEAIGGVEVASLVGRRLEPTREVAGRHRIPHATTDLAEALALPGVEAVILCTPTQMNALGEPRSWTDHLLWHHAAHTIDLFQYQTGEEIAAAHALQGPEHPELGIAMDMSIQLKTRGGSLCTLSLSFNNEGPLGTFFRYICDRGTYIARYDDLVTGKDERVDLSGVAVSTNGIERQDREFLAAIREGREPNASVAQVLPCYRVLHELETLLSRKRS
jgi:2-hydroxy-4-carboxymuconate semialdehyde hemiacetal dehydrogenase